MEEDLEKQLMKLRNKLSLGEKVLIFSNGEIAEMAKSKPRNEKQLLRIDGIDEKKVEKYGESFLALIKLHLSDESGDSSKEDEELELYAGKRNVKTRFVKLNLGTLHFYPQNPRISSIIIHYKGELDDDKIHELMNEKQAEATRSLFQQVKKDRLINEPLIVYKDMVLEGNTRLWVLRELVQKSKTNEERMAWSEVPCRVIEEKLTEEEINHILCNVHIKTKRDWSPFEQACYLARMYEHENMTYNQISEITSFTYQKIKLYIDVYKEMEKHKAEKGDWNRYHEAYKDKAVKDVHDKGKYDVFATIQKKTKEGKMGCAQDSRKLKKILTSKRATKAFFEDDADIARAHEMAIAENPEEGDPLLKRVKDLGEDLKHMPFDKLQDIKKDKSKIKVIEELMDELKKLCKVLKVNV